MERAGRGQKAQKFPKQWSPSKIKFSMRHYLLCRCVDVLKSWPCQTFHLKPSSTVPRSSVFFFFLDTAYRTGNEEWQVIRSSTFHVPCAFFLSKTRPKTRPNNGDENTNFRKTSRKIFRGLEKLSGEGQKRTWRLCQPTKTNISSGKKLRIARSTGDSPTSYQYPRLLANSTHY